MADQSATGAPQAPLGTEGNPTHVVSRPAPTIGWAGVQSGVEEFDKEEIQGYKEDMDALLVFIGLFSAVLAGFVAMSFSLLQASPADSMVFIMTGMSIQAASYTITGSFINSTTPAPTSLPQFEPSHNAIVVNILWTASLIVSLATASFAICVKQWLRGYTASTTSFALYKMRIRFFRRLALQDWDVLEIASALPFLLQMSLALFFVGLCYFTADIHPSVKNTAFPLVSAWAFFFIAATILPVFSARCPYKTPALGSLTALTRNGLRLVWKRTLQTLVTISADKEEQPADGEEQLADGRTWSELLHSIWGAICAWPSTAQSGLSHLWTKAAHKLTAVREHLDRHSSFIGAMSAIINTWATEALVSMDDKAHPHDELSAIKTDTQDLENLLKADRLHGDDEVVEVTISRVVIQSKVKWQDAITFTLGLIRNRLSVDTVLSEPGFIDLKDLTPRALAAVHNVLDYIDSLQVQAGVWFPLLNPDKNDIGPARWAIFLRLSVSLLQPPTKLPRWLEGLDGGDSIRLAEICEPSKSVPALRSLLTLLCRRLEQRDFDLSTSVSRLESFLGVYFGELGVPDSFHPGQSMSWSDILNKESLGPTVAWLTQRLKSDSATSAAGSSNGRSRETAWGNTVSLIVKLMAVAEHIDEFGGIPRMAVKSSKMLQKFWVSCFNYRLYPSQYLVPQGGLDAEGLSNIKTAIAALASDPTPEIDGEKALALCRDLCRSLWNNHRGVRALKLVPAWRDVFDALTQLVQRTQAEDYDAARDLVNRCFLWIEDVDGTDNSDDDKEYTEWLATFNSEDSPVPDEFISELLHINPNPHHPASEEESYLRLWRVRRLNKFSANAQSQAKGTAIPHAPVTPLAMSNVGSDDEVSTSQSGDSVVGDEDAPVDEASPVPIDGHNRHSQIEASIEMQNANSEELMAPAVDDAASSSTPNVTAAGTHNPLRHLGSHVHALHNLSTAAQMLAEALLAKLPAEDTDSSGGEVFIRSERPVVTVAIEESMVIAGTTVPGEDVTGTCQVEAAGSDTSNRDEQLPGRRPAQAPDATTSDAPSPPAVIVTQGPSSQDLSSGDSEGGTHSASLDTSGAVPKADNYQSEADMENTTTDSYTAPAVTLSSSLYAHPSEPDQPPETLRRESLREESFNTRSSVDEDIKKSTNAAGPSGSDTAEATDPGGTSGRMVSRRHSGPVHSVRRGDDDGDQSRDGDGNVSTREGAEDGGGGDHP